jgi:ATP-dependent RNA helicase DDX1
MSAFEELGVCPELIRAAEDAGWLLPTAVQAEATPLILGGGDVLVAAETGSGKTGAFGVPVLQIVHESLRNAAVARVATRRGTSGPVPGDESSPGTATTAGEIAMSAADRSDAFAVSPDGYRAQARDLTKWAGGRASIGVTSGKHYYEAEVTDDGLVRVGWSARDSKKLDALGTDKKSWGYGGTGKKSHAGAFEAFPKEGGGVAYAKGDVVGCALDCDEGVISFFKNGKAVDGVDGVAFRFDPIAVFGRVSEKNEKKKKRGSGTALFPAVCLKNAECVLRFGNSKGDAFKHTPPSGFGAIARAAEGQWVSGDDDDDDDDDDDIVPTDVPVDIVGTASSPRTPRALIVEPTRELAEQTCLFFESFATHLATPKVGTALFVGGGGGRDSKKAQTEVLRNGFGCDVAVGTPGRVVDLVESGVLDLTNVRFFVLDEADALLESGNREVIERIRARLPGGGASGDGFTKKKVTATFGRVQTLLFSATLRSPSVQRLAERMCVNPTWVDLKGYDHVPDAVLHAMVAINGSSGPDHPTRGREEDARLAEFVRARTDNVHFFLKGDAGGDASAARDRASFAIKTNKLFALKRAIDAFRALVARDETKNKGGGSRSSLKTLIFCRTNFDCERVAAFLGDVGNLRRTTNRGANDDWSALCLGGALSNDERRENLAAFKAGNVPFLVCTDVAARGIDVREVPFLINVTLPESAEEYVHRVGRVGRAGAPGFALSLVADAPERVWFCKKKGLKPWLEPSVDDVKQHTVWMEESVVLAKIENRLKEELTRLDAREDPDGGSALTRSFTKFADSVAARVDVVSGAVVRVEDAAASAELAARLELYAPATRRLAQLEVDAQTSFWTLKRKFADA